MSRLRRYFVGHACPSSSPRPCLARRSHSWTLLTLRALWRVPAARASASPPLVLLQHRPPERASQCYPCCAHLTQPAQFLWALPDSATTCFLTLHRPYRYLHFLV